MKILHVITSLRIGGAEKLMVDLLPRLREKGNEIDLCVFDGKKTSFYTQIENTGIRIITLSSNKNVYNPLHIFRLWKLMRKYDIVHTHNTACQMYAAIGGLLCSTNLVTTEHNTSNRRRQWNWYACIDKWMYSRYKKVICISDQVKTRLCTYIKSNHQRICTIYNGVDINSFMNAKPLERIVSEFNGTKTVAMVAGFRLQKDQDTLIKAFKYLPDEYHLLFIGDGVRLPECKELSKQMGVEKRVHFLGEYSEVHRILKSVDVVAMSSHYEGFSLACVEGMASGKPLVASDVDGIHEIVGNSGVLFPHGDEKALAQAIINLTNNSEYRTEVIKNCLYRAKKFDIETMADNYNKLYMELI